MRGQIWIGKKRIGRGDREEEDGKGFEIGREGRLGIGMMRGEGGLEGNRRGEEGERGEDSKGRGR